MSDRYRLEYTADAAVRDAIISIGRTEDIRFSPSSRRLAIVGIRQQTILVLDVEIEAAVDGVRATLTGGLTLSSAALRSPHGIDFIDDETIAVANRKGAVALFHLPPGASAVPPRVVEPAYVIAPESGTVAASPGSVYAATVNAATCELLVCDNVGHRVLRHVLDRTPGYALRRTDIVASRWLEVPDGVCVTRDRRWTAVSNHNRHCVMLYDTAGSEMVNAEPTGILRGARCPHGLRFTDEGRRLFLADAAAPFVHIYEAADGDWSGVRWPATSVPVMTMDVFRSGAHTADEGGPKGIDLDRSGRLLVTTSENAPLAMFDASAMRSHRAEAYAQRALAMEHELLMLERIEIACQEVQSVTSSRSWTLTAPLRGALEWMRKRKPAEPGRRYP